jgi:Ca2+-binding RTX toxin-like protein
MDVLTGDSNDNILTGGDGADTLTGNAGADTFAFEAATAFNDIDTITDFDTGEGDALDIGDMLFAYDPLEDALADFIEITDDGTDSTVKVDMDGTGTTHSFAQFATLEDVTGLTDEAALLANGNLII